MVGILSTQRRAVGASGKAQCNLQTWYQDNTEGIRNSDNERSAPRPEGKLISHVLTLAHLNPFRR